MKVLQKLSQVDCNLKKKELSDKNRSSLVMVEYFTFECLQCKFKKQNQASFTKVTWGNISDTNPSN